MCTIFIYDSKHRNALHNNQRNIQRNKNLFTEKIAHYFLNNETKISHLFLD